MGKLIIRFIEALAKTKNKIDLEGPKATKIKWMDWSRAWTIKLIMYYVALSLRFDAVLPFDNGAIIVQFIHQYW